MRTRSDLAKSPAAKAALAVLSVISLIIAGCGSGGTTASGNSSDTVRVSVGQASSMPGAPAAQGAVPAADNIDHAWITVNRIALVPSGSIDPADRRGPDVSGEPSVPDSGAPDPGLVSGEIVPPTEIDLLNLPPGEIARFLNDIPNIPAGSYGKIRLYYSDPKVHFFGAPDNQVVKATAHAHVDVHFVGGDLVIPVRTAPPPAGGVFIHNVTIRVVLGKDGLKIVVNPNKILMRPQIFAEVSPVQFGITGTADNVAPGAFDVETADFRSFHAVYGDNTNWFFKDGTHWISIDPPARAIAAFRDGAIVDVLGLMPAGNLIVADDILITFPFDRSGTVASGTPSNGWKADNTFELNLTSDNVVYPKPDRAGALYEGGTDNAIVQGVFVKARGYHATAPGGGVEAYWITIGP